MLSFEQSFSVDRAMFDLLFVTASSVFERSKVTIKKCHDDIQLRIVA